VVGWNASRLDAVDSAVYEWATGSTSPVELIGATIYPSFTGLPAVDARLRAFEESACVVGGRSLAPSVAGGGWTELREQHVVAACVGIRCIVLHVLTDRSARPMSNNGCGCPCWNTVSDSRRFYSMQLRCARFFDSRAYTT
jgi:hypothetical protein